MKKRRDMIWPALVLLIVALGLGLRVGKAWTASFSPNSDFTVSALSAKHMAEGRDFPVFFYGIPYMGNVEPYVTVAICRLLRLEVTGFTVNLGAALVGAILLPLVYLFGCAAGGRRAGVIAMLYCLVGSDTNFHYAGSARNGLMVMLAGGFFVVWMACRIATRLRKNEAVSWASYLGMGLVAGLGWWASQLVIFFLATAAVILLFGFGWKMIRQGLVPGLAGFFVGSLPWWWWNITHDWGTFDFAGSLGKVPFRAGLHSYCSQVLVLTELSSGAAWWSIVRLALFSGMLVLFMALVVRAARRPEEKESFFYRLSVPVLFLVGALIFSTSHYARFAASKYVLPLFPIVAVMLGVSADWLLRRFRLPFGWLVFIVLVPPHLYQIGWGIRDVAQDRPKWEAASRLADDLGPLCGGVCIGEWPLHWMNFASGERLCVASLPKEYYAPYARRGELAEKPAFLGDCRGIRTFLRYTGGKSVQAELHGIPVDYGLTPPPDDWRYADPTNIVTAEDADNKPCDGALWDGVLDTRWSGVMDATKPLALAFGFNRQVRLCGIRMLSSDDAYPNRVMVEGKAQDDGPWETMLPMTRMADYFWSGRHVMTEGVQFSQELRFAGPTGGVSRVRLTFQAGDRPRAVRLGEVLFMEQGPSPEWEFPSVDACIAALRSAGVKKFYGPRWMADRVAVAMGDEIETLVPSLINRSVQDLAVRDSVCPHPVVVRENTGFMTDSRNAKRSGMILNKAGLEYKETALGCYALLVVSKPDSGKDAARYPLLYWTEQGCFAADMRRFASRQAQVLYDQAVAAGKSGSRAAALQLLQDAVGVYPEHQPARRALIAALEAGGQSREAAANAAILKAQTMPDVPAPIRFRGGIEFLGLTLSTREAAAGGFIEINYFWQCPPRAAAATRPRMFAHFIKGKQICFQDDHDLLDDIRSDDLRGQPFDEVFTEHRRVEIPPSAAPGEYKIAIGLYDKMSGQRLRLKTGLPAKRREAILPILVNVRGGG